MSQRLPRTTKWLWYIMALYAGSFWSPARCVTIRTPPGNPATVEAQAKFFQYRHLPTSEDFDQGHRLGSDHHFTERHERSRPSAGLFSAKVRWGDKKGGYGEHYWDLNHAGHAGNNGDDGYDTGSDDGSYREDHNIDPYDEPSQNSPTYDNDNYDPEKSSYEESGRAKRAHPKVKLERKSVETQEEEQPKQKQSRKNEEHLQPKPNKQEEKSADGGDIDDDNKRTKVTRHQYKNQDQNNEEDNEKPKEQKKQIVLVLSHKEKETENQASQFVPKRPDRTHYVPYESGAGVRQHHQAELSTVASIPRLFLEPSTGHVVDRSTGQAYVLQPIASNNNYN